jgi:predicted ATPase
MLLSNQAACMLRTLKIRGFKSLKDQEIRFSDLTVLFGPNAAGKSNVLDAIQALSRIGTERTLTEALSAPIRGYPIEAFSFPPGGLPDLLSRKSASFSLQADLNAGTERYGYEVEVQIHTGSGALTVRNECLRTLTKSGGESQGRPRIETEGGRLLIRSRSRPGRPREEPVGLNHTKLSDPRLGGPEYLAIERCRAGLSGWRTYYLDPRVAMREARPPMEVTDIGVLVV